MSRKIKYLIAATVATIALAAGGTAAYAHFSSDERDAFLEDVAGRLGVEREALENAIQDAHIERVNTAEAEGKISSERADQLRERIESGEARLGFGHHRFDHRGFGFRGLLGQAAEFLGFTGPELREQLPGTSLAALAEQEGKSVDGLTQTLVAAVQEGLDAKVEAGRLTEAQAAELREQIASKIGELVTRTWPEEGRFGPKPFGPRGAGDLGVASQNGVVTL